MPMNLRADGYIADRAFNRPLLLEHAKGLTIAHYLEQRMMGTHQPQPMAFCGDDDYSDSLRVDHEGVAIISVFGTLVHRKGTMDAMSGMTSYQHLREEIIGAANDGSIKTILLDIDSGGGEVEGNFELSRLIRQINDEVKPVIAISNGAAYSGAFSIGVSAGSFYVTETGGVGSVGVIIQHIDYSEANKMRGIKVTQVTAGENKSQFSQDFPLSPKAKEALKKEVDRCAEIFISHVATMRNIPDSVVKSTEASLLFGQDAVSIGFVDGIVSFAELLEGLTQTDLPQEPIETRQRMNEMFGKLNKKSQADKTEPAADEVPTSDAPEQVEHENEPEEETIDPPVEDGEGEETEAEKAAQIVEICSAAGHPEMAAGFIRKKVNIQEVKETMDVNQQIRKACTLAGKPDKAAGFIESGKSLKQVQDDLITEMSDAQDDISSKESPEDVTKDFSATKNVILADVEARKQAANKGV